MPNKAKSPTIGTPPVSGSTTLMPICAESAWPNGSSATAGSVPPQRGDLGRQVAQMRELYPDAEIVTDVAGGLNWQRKGLLSILERLHRGDKLDVVVAHRDRLARFGFELIEWLVVQNGGAVLVLNQSDASPESTHRGSTRHSPHVQLPYARTPTATERQSRRTRVYPNANSRKFMIATWLDASRWVYNLTVEVLQSGIPAAWRHIAGMVMSELKVLKPEWESVPYQVKRTAVRDAGRAMSNVKTFNRQLAADRARGERPDEDHSHNCGSAAAKTPRQSCYIPDDAVTEHGVYHTILGPLRMAEVIPTGHKECRLVQERGLYWLIVPYPAQCDIETPSGDGVVALDPGVRTFLTYFSETDCGKLGHHAFGRIQRLCHWLDDLISRTDTEPNHKRRRRMRWAQARLRQRIINLVDELHWQNARWLTGNYKVILLPTFETQDMTRRAGRRIRSKTARMMLSFRHYEFKQRLRWKAWQRGALVIEVNEAYTSKTLSWDGSIKSNLGGASVIRDESGFGMDRDVNGARGIFLRALGDSPFLRGLLTQVAAQSTATSSNVV